MAEPMLQAIFLKADTLRMVRRQHRVIGTHLFDEAAIARAAAIGNHDVIIGALLGTSASKANLESHTGIPFFSDLKRGVW